MPRTVPEPLADEDLVEQFLGGDKFDSDDAFRALVARHGPMVLGICRLILDQEADAEDAFHAIFLILARRGASIRNRAMVVERLHGLRASNCGQGTCQYSPRRRYLERQSVSMCPSQLQCPTASTRMCGPGALRPVLHDEVRRLPNKYRVPVILSYLEGKTNDEVAALLQWPVGTVRGRLSRARSLLRSRLVRREMAISADFLVTSMSDGVVFAEIVPADLVNRTVRFVQKFSPRLAAADPPSTPS